MPAPSASAAGVLSLLEENDDGLKVAALENINKIMDQFWSEVADSVDMIEQLSEDSSFANCKLAAIVASKVYYHLEEYDDALKFALDAGDMLDLTDQSQYTHTMVRQAIDEYVAEKFEEQKFRVVSEMRILAKIRLGNLDFVGYVEIFNEIWCEIGF